MPLSRRAVCCQIPAVLLARSLRCFALRSQAEHPAPPSARPDVAAIDHDRILAAADHLLGEGPRPLPSIPAPRSPGSPQDFFSENNGEDPIPIVSQPATPSTDDTSPPRQPDLDRTAPPPMQPGFFAHRDALFSLSLAVPTLAAASALTRESKPEAADRYAAHALEHLRAWFVVPGTRMTPNLSLADLLPGTTTPRFQGILDGTGLAEIAQAVPFLAIFKACTPEDLAGIRHWFSQYLDWLTNAKLAGLARDQKDRHGSSWLLQAIAAARLTNNEAAISELRHRFKSVTIRAQINADGAFPHELTTLFPYRYSLFNLDMLCAVCDLLSTKFESVWDFQLQDGPGMRSAIARHYPFIEDRNSWPYKADLMHFKELPGRRPGLLLAARAYTRPEYAELWKRLPPDPKDPAILRTIPIHQPLLWITRPPVGPRPV